VAGPAASAHLNQQGESPQAITPARRVSDLMKEARSYRQLDRISNSRLSKLINAFVSQEIVDRDLVSWALGYGDPTAAQAIRNVVRERGY
jgi:uncharacterized protein YjiS (DUF1127 family)